MKCLKAIFTGLNVRDEIQKDAFLEFRRILDDAVEKGYRQVTDKADPFLDMLRHGNAVISAFKTHRMQNDMAARLLDKDGRLKPFRTWMRDVKDIASHYTVRWLRTEYDTAILRAHEAAAWRQARQEADVLPNLRWMPTTSASPDVIHKAFWSMKLTLPVNHPFWKKHRPQDRWGCKCSIMQTDEPATELKGLGKADRIKPVPGLDNNPADDGMVFGKSHPYITKAYPGAEKAAAKTCIGEIIQDLRQGHPVGKTVLLGRLPEDVAEFITSRGINLNTKDVYISDKGIRHALRNVKQQAGKAVTEKQLNMLPDLMDTCEVYWDDMKKNIQFVTYQDNEIQKFVVELNYKTKINGKKDTVNYFVTAGKIDETTLVIHKKIR